MKQQASSVERIKRDGCGAKYSCASTSLGSRATPPRYVMEELNFLLAGYSEPAIAAGFRPAMRQIASGGHCGVAECRAVRPYSV